MTPFAALGSIAFSSAAAPATSAAEADVPVIDVVAAAGGVVRMLVAGRGEERVRAVVADEPLSASFWSVLETPMTPRSPAGKVAVAEPSLPVAATTTTPCAHA